MFLIEELRVAPFQNAAIATFLLMIVTIAQGIAADMMIVASPKPLSGLVRVLTTSYLNNRAVRWFVRYALLTFALGVIWSLITGPTRTFLILFMFPPYIYSIILSLRLLNQQRTEFIQMLMDEVKNEAKRASSIEIGEEFPTEGNYTGRAFYSTKTSTLYRFNVDTKQWE